MDLRQRLAVTPIYDWLGKRSYAQSGEDLIADIELGKKKRGFYVDIGAYHPKMFSNTYLFYKRGWRGICVDPNPEMETLYVKARPRDVFLNFGVGDCFGSAKAETRNDDKGCVMTYYMFEDGAVNTFSEEQARKNTEEAGRKMIEKRMVAVLPLKTIFEKYLPVGQEIDLLSVDVEGMDLEVLKSNNWKKYRPKVIIAEDLGFDFGSFLHDPSRSLLFGNTDPLRRLLKGKHRDSNGVVGFLERQGYRLKDKTPYSLIFEVVK